MSVMTGQLGMIINKKLYLRKQQQFVLRVDNSNGKRWTRNENAGPANFNTIIAGFRWIISTKYYSVFLRLALHLDSKSSLGSTYPYGKLTSTGASSIADKSRLECCENSMLYTRAVDSYLRYGILKIMIIQYSV